MKAKLERDSAKWVMIGAIIVIPPIFLWLLSN